MGVRVGSLAKQEEDAQIRVGENDEDVVNIRYRPGALTLGALDRMGEAASSRVFDAGAFEELLKPILVSWDLLDDEGNPLPITREGLHQLPMEFLGELISTLASGAKVDAEEGKASSGTSEVTERSDSSLIGTSSSEQPATSA